ncbi:MAG: choice-of-anchor tandem repeat GloVer-containing protein [Candidatus Sulfotelmatobacter sp.]
MFCSFCTKDLYEDGTEPEAGVILDSAGNLYGTTPSGGHPRSGTIFQLTPADHGSWVWKLLYAFARGTENTLVA